MISLLAFVWADVLNKRRGASRARGRGEAGPLFIDVTMVGRLLGNSVTLAESGMIHVSGKNVTEQRAPADGARTPERPVSSFGSGRKLIS